MSSWRCSYSSGHKWKTKTMLARRVSVSGCDVQNAIVHGTDNGSRKAHLTASFFQALSQILGPSLVPISDTREMRQTFHFTRLPHNLVTTVITTFPFPISRLPLRFLSFRCPRVRHNCNDALSSTLPLRLHLIFTSLTHKFRLTL